MPLAFSEQDSTRGTHVDTSWDTTRGKVDDVQRSEIRLAEDVYLKVFAPWEDLDQFRRIVHEDLILGTEGFIDDGGEPFPLGASTVRVDVGLDETNVALDYRADVLYPVRGSSLMVSDRSGLEAVEKD